VRHGKQEDNAQDTLKTFYSKFTEQKLRQSISDNQLSTNKRKNKFKYSKLFKILRLRKT